MKTLSGLTAALLLSAYCCTALASGADEANREFIRQQESFSQQLRGAGQRAAAPDAGAAGAPEPSFSRRRPLYRGAETAPARGPAG
nr:hypothetical protein [Enterobacter hormaechei]